MARRPDPFERMEQLFEQMRRSMATPFSEPWAGHDAPALEGPGAFESNVSLETVEDGYVVLADLPGFEREEIEVSVTDGRLTIGAVHEGEDEGGYRARSFHESITLPGEVDIEDAEATYSNGVLEIHLPSNDVSDEAYSIDIE